MQKLRTCLFPCGGFGTRFLPITKAIPKEMIPVVDKPLIHYAVLEAMKASFKNMSIIHARNKDAIVDYFDTHYELEVKLEGQTNKLGKLEEVDRLIKHCNFLYMRQSRAAGLGHAVLAGKPSVSEGESFGVVLADDFCTVEGDVRLPMRQLRATYEAFDEKGAPVGVVLAQEVPNNQKSNYGIIDIDPIPLTKGVFRARQLLEKPQPDEVESNLAVIGRYLLPHDIFAHLETTAPDKSGEIQLTPALDKLAKEGRMLVCVIEGRRFDCGQVGGYIEATKYVASQRR